MDLLGCLPEVAVVDLGGLDDIPAPAEDRAVEEGLGGVLLALDRDEVPDAPARTSRC
jgi:hypothetical protein